MQTSTILPLVEWDFAAAFKACDKAGQAYVGICYDSMGRDIAGYTLHDPIESGQLCLGGQKYLNGACLAGAAKQLVDYHGGTDQGFQMCENAPRHANMQCYRAMGEMVYFYWNEDPARSREECAKARYGPYIKACEVSAQVRGARVIPID
jgi:hypothetical protein